jgi:hypothetical protein
MKTNLDFINNALLEQSLLEKYPKDKLLSLMQNNTCTKMWEQGVLGINYLTVVRSDPRGAIPACMASLLVVTALIITAFVFQISRGPEEGLIQ